ncbi:MAG: hypothetical protein ACRC6V_00690 [Bacteroidales bacterium]
MNLNISAVNNTIVMNDRVISALPDAELATDAAQKLNFLVANGAGHFMASLNQILESDAGLSYDGNIPQLASVCLLSMCGVDMNLISAISPENNQVALHLGTGVEGDPEAINVLYFDEKVFGEVFLGITHLQQIADPTYWMVSDVAFAIFDGWMQRVQGDEYTQQPRIMYISATACAYLYKDEAGETLSEEGKVLADAWPHSVLEWEMDEEDTSLRDCPLTGETDIMTRITY